MNEQLSILQHSLGVDQHGQGSQFRNHFCTGPGTTDYPRCQALAAQGLMTQRAGNTLSGGSDIFMVTDAGKAFVREHSPKSAPLTRSQRRYRNFLSSGASDAGYSFGEWLKRKPGVSA